MMEGVMGSTTRSPTLFPPVNATGKFTFVQLLPLLVERKSPELVPTYNVVESFGSTARELTTLLVSPLFMPLHVLPLSVDRKMPRSLVLAYAVAGAFGLMARQKDEVQLPRPKCNDFQVLPPSTELKRRSCELATLAVLPAYKVVGVRGSMTREVGS